MTRVGRFEDFNCVGLLHVVVAGQLRWSCYVVRFLLFRLAVDFFLYVSVALYYCLN